MKDALVQFTPSEYPWERARRPHFTVTGQISGQTTGASSTLFSAMKGYAIVAYLAPDGVPRGAGVAPHDPASKPGASRARRRSTMRNARALLDAARRLQDVLVSPARQAAARL